MNNTQTDETKNEKISEKWGAFAKRLQEKFWKESNMKPEYDITKENKLYKSED